MNTVLEPEPLESAPKAKSPIDAGLCPRQLEKLAAQPEVLAEGLATTTEEKPDEPHSHIRKNIKTAIRVCVTLAVAAGIAIIVLAVLASVLMC